VIVVAKRTAYRRFVEEENDPRARQLLRSRDPSVQSWRDSHRAHMKTLETVRHELEKLGARAVLVQRAHAEFDTSDARLVVSVGGDGTLLAASHNVGQVPILGVNSAPHHSVGFFCAARQSTVGRMLAEALEDRLHSVRLTRMTVAVNGRIRSRRVLNEALFCHASPAATSRYILSYGRVREEQRTSGFWIGPAAGSTAAQRSAGGKTLPLASAQLQLVVREPYAAFNGREYRLLRVVVEPQSRLIVKSKMQDGCLFLDGPYRQVAVRLGDEVTFYASDEPLTVLGLKEGAKGSRGRGVKGRKAAHSAV
jgi:NAD+ kinase